MTAPLDMGRYFQRRGVKLTAKDKALAAATIRPLEPEPEERREPTAAEREHAPMLARLVGYDPTAAERYGGWP